MRNFASKSFFSQSFNLPEPTFTEQNLSDQAGRVVIVTGSYSGVGNELCRILFTKNAKVYIAGSNPRKAGKSGSAIKANCPNSVGRLEFLQLDLSDLASIKNAAQSFLDREHRLDVLVNHAGVMFPPSRSETAQGYELQMGTNVLGHLFLSKLLLPIMQMTATTAPPNSTRVLWAGSLGIDLFSPRNGVQFDSYGNAERFSDPQTNYGPSKTANVYLAQEFARRYKEHRIISVCFNPRSLKTELHRHSSKFEVAIGKLLLYPAIYGAYPELFSGWSGEITPRAVWHVYYPMGAGW